MFELETRARSEPDAAYLFLLILFGLSRQALLLREPVPGRE